MGVATVGLTYDLARSRFGRAAGLVAGLTLALTPITVAISRHNNPDALLVLCLVGARVGAGPRSAPGGQPEVAVPAGVFVGLGFETKMAAALLVVPGLVAAWLWVAPKGRITAVKQLLAGGAAMAAVGLAWPMLMWLTPASDASVHLGHGRQLDLVADPRLQRPRPPVRPERRAGWRHGRRRRWRRVRRRGRPGAPAQRRARRPGGLAHRLRARRGARPPAHLAPEARRRPHRAT